MSATVEAMSVLGCAQCGTPLPADPAERGGWEPYHVAVLGTVDETAAGVLLCPDCVAEDRSGEYDAGGGD